ncbi:alkaline phosphatase family protein [Nocardioides marmoribigeumensis]|uniref:Phosphoesterase n=1 Tax=Nocardioides marmoribigeumensis TaxID=433649 RepID=A0ABU2BZV3_9ACTN|nr:alkaline phosphatase family protein [Nocardioides marmoribigeumensis]MDR7363894.1 hypothetical protein [Nocardioides marmoribigeumensis]
MTRTLRPVVLLLSLAIAAAAVLVLVVTPSRSQASVRPLGVAARMRSAARASAPSISRYVPPVRHVFVINLENKGYDKTWGPGSKAPYLATTLRRKGVLLNAYHGTAHNSQPNYVAQVSGQGPNPDMQADCQVFSPFQGSGTEAPGQYRGVGCVFPRTVRNIGRQLTAHSLSWKGYMEGMSRACQHPAVGSQDPTQKATATHAYAVRHNPFMYFRSIIDHPAYCRRHVVPLARLRTDLERVRTTPHLTYITPDLCHDGHDAPCANGEPGGLVSVNRFMRRWVPRILQSPAYRRNGMLVITADEADSPQSDASACCGDDGPTTNSPLPGISGFGGGTIGALVISRWTRANTWSSTPYNHYSLLASLEEVFRLPKLGYAARAGRDRFGLDVYNNGWQLR